jgi:hypothetical protein
VFITFRDMLHPCCEKFLWCEAHNHLPTQPSVFRTECYLLFADPQNATLSDGGTPCVQPFVASLIGDCWLASGRCFEHRPGAFYLSPIEWATVRKIVDGCTDVKTNPSIFGIT